MRTRGIVVTIGLAAGLVLGTAATGSAEPPEWANGRAAIERLGARLPAVAAANALTASELRSHLLTDSSLYVDGDDRLLYVEPTRPVTADTTASTTAATTDSVFTLHSALGANRVIYLDFDGETITGTAWNNSTGGKSCYTDPYDSDGSPSTFSQAELTEIAGVWARVAEDYAPFGVDVTTADPGPAAIDRAGTSDDVYGTRALITYSKTKCARNKTLYQSVCNRGCGGVAYVGVFDDAAKHSYYQPALIFQNGVGSGQKYVAEAVSHEVGHNLGLSHDGTASTGYYQGHGSWAPIMGVGYYKAITQWSRGEYAGANNREDDLAVMEGNGAPPVADEASPASLTIGATATGVISTRTDTDEFSFTVAGASSVTITANPAAKSSDLDISLALTDSVGNLLDTDDPASAAENLDKQDVAVGMGATIIANLETGTYLLTIDGVGVGDPLNSGYSDYASIGAYTIQVTTP